MWFSILWWLKWFFLISQNKKMYSLVFFLSCFSAIRSCSPVWGYANSPLQIYPEWYQFWPLKMAVLWIQPAKPPVWFAYESWSCSRRSHDLHQSACTSHQWGKFAPFFIFNREESDYICLSTRELALSLDVNSSNNLK